MSKSVKFDPTLGAPESDRSDGKEWRRINNIQENSTSATISLEEINSEERKSRAEEAAIQARTDATLTLRKSSKSVTNLASLGLEDSDKQIQK